MTAVLLCLAILLGGPPQQGGTSTFGAAAGPVARDPTVVEKKGTAILRGKITAADTGRPLRRVRITVTAPELSEPRSVSTNLQGIYELRDLPPGRYTVAATRTGYLTMRHGQRRPGEAGQPLQIADAQLIDKIDLALPKMGVIAGRITDEVGDPLAGVNVMPMRVRYFRGQRRLVPSGGSGLLRSDDTGQYRIIGLEPGDYFVMAHTRETWTQGDEKNTLGFVITLFPGTTVAAEAQRIKVGVGQEVSGIDIPMIPGRAISIRGTATRSDGTPLVGESINLTQEFAGPSGSSSFGFGGGKVAPDGTFVLKNILPGQYKVSVKAPAESGRPLEGAQTIVNASGADLEGVTLVTGGAGSISGRIVTDAGQPPSFPGTRLRVSTTPLEPDSTFTTFAEDNGRVRDDWTFDVRDVMGAHRVSVAPLPSGWGIRAVEVEGHEAADTGLTVQPGQRADVTIVISNKMATLAGTLRDDTAKPVAGTIILFPEDPANWRENSRHVRTARPDQSGTFELKLLPAGDYLVAAVDYVQDGEWNDPEYLKSIHDGASRVTLHDGQTASAALVLKKR
jgi:hypothetical protein